MNEVLSASRGGIHKLQQKKVLGTTITNGENKTPLNIHHSISKAHMQTWGRCLYNRKKEREESIYVLVLSGHNCM